MSHENVRVCIRGHLFPRHLRKCRQCDADSKRAMRASKNPRRQESRNALGPPGDPRPAHVVCSRLLRKLLTEAVEKGYLSDALTGDSTQYEMRVRAALSVCKAI